MDAEWLRDAFSCNLNYNEGIQNDVFLLNWRM